ncbi:MAG: substrate-binding domain-containing protein [Lachnospiraceae bacterium]|nr:substrate-binding domain-containing protein [Lachnospiraceae bacterium]
MVIALIIISVLEALAIVALILVILKKNASQTKITRQAGLIIKGKLNVEDIIVENSDNANALMASAFNSIKNNLLTFVESTKVNVVTLSDAIEVLYDSVEANAKGNEQIADGATNVAIKTAEQLELVKDNLTLIESNNKQIQDIDLAMKSIKDILDDTVKSSKSGIDNIEDFENDMLAMAADLNRINDILSKFNSEILRIGEVGKFIVEISDQLRLLAFNSSIEAARAGQAGKGFTVVADEMNVMSAKTRDGMQTINEILKEIINSSKMVNDSITNCENTYNRSKEAFNTVNSSFRVINESSLGIHDKINDITGLFDVMTDNTDKSRDLAETLYETAQSISENTHEIAAVSQEVAAESSKIGVNTEALNGMLSGIQNLLKQFNTAIVPTEKKSAKQVKILEMSMLDNDFWFGVRKGALYAQKELSDKNALIEYAPFVPNTIPLNDFLSETIQSCIDRQFDGIIFPGFLGSVGPAEKLFNAASSKGVKLMAYNCDCGKEVPRLSCLRPDSHEPGILAAKAAEKKLGGQGSVLMLTGDRTVEVNVERSEGFKMQLKGSKVGIAAELTIPDNADEVYRIAKAGLQSHPEAGVVFITNGFPLSAAKAIRDSGRVGKTSLVCFDHNQEIFSEIKAGVITAAIGQDAFGQGHDPIIWLYNNIVAGDKLDEYIPCRLSVVDRSNVDSLVEA